MIDPELDRVAEAKGQLLKSWNLWDGPGKSVMRNPEGWIVETVESR